ncbi:MAG: hypothetical protein AAF628_30395 [Planctomycetota bacterium]
MFQLNLLSAVAAVFLASAASAQTVYVPDSSQVGGCMTTPFGLPALSPLSDMRYQTMATAADLGNPTGPITIANIGFAPCNPRGDNVTHHATIKVTMAQTDAASLSGVFQNNLVNNVVTVLDATDYQWKSVGGEWSRLGMQRSYTFDPSMGANLVLDICVTGSKKCSGTSLGFHPGERWRVVARGGCLPTGVVEPFAALKWCLDIDAWSLNEYGKGCQDLDLQLTGSGQLGENVTISLSGHPPSALCVLIVGNRDVEPGFDLSGIGATGCKVYVNSLLAIPTSGKTFKVPPGPHIIGERLCAQFHCLDSSYPGMVATSDEGVIIVGNAQ